MRTTKRYRFVRDDDGHNYLIEDYQEESFEQLLEKGLDTEYEEFNSVFADCRIDGIEQWTFTDPKKDD